MQSTKDSNFSAVNWDEDSEDEELVSSPQQRKYRKIDNVQKIHQKEPLYSSVLAPSSKARSP